VTDPWPLPLLTLRPNRPPLNLAGLALPQTGCRISFEYAPPPFNVSFPFCPFHTVRIWLNRSTSLMIFYEVLRDKRYILWVPARLRPQDPKRPPPPKETNFAPVFRHVIRDFLAPVLSSSVDPTGSYPTCSFPFVGVTALNSIAHHLLLQHSGVSPEARSLDPRRPPF